MIEVSKEYAAQSGATSYSGASAFDGLPPTSPAGVMNGDPLDSANAATVLPHRHNLLRKPVQGGEDDDSLKSRKRFSKRHSKNGLAAVF